MKRTTWLGMTVVVALAFTAACGDDDEGGEAAPPDEPTTTTGGGGGEAGDFCPAYIELLAGDPSPEQIREVAAIAPEGAAEPLETIATGFEEDPEGFFDTEEFATAFGEVGEVATGECADSEITVTAVDYGFEGFPADLPAGVLGIAFSNEGEEFHELVVLRRNDGVEQSFEEILGLGEEEGQSLVTEAGGTFAPPGRSSSALVELEPGEYAAVCFIPVGSTPESEGSEGSEGPPHFTQGMIAEFSVS